MFWLVMGQSRTRAWPGRVGKNHRFGWPCFRTRTQPEHITSFYQHMVEYYSFLCQSVCSYLVILNVPLRQPLYGQGIDTAADLPVSLEAIAELPPPPGLLRRVAPLPPARCLLHRCQGHLRPQHDGRTPLVEARRPGKGLPVHAALLHQHQAPHVPPGELGGASRAQPENRSKFSFLSKLGKCGKK